MDIQAKIEDLISILRQANEMNPALKFWSLKSGRTQLTTNYNNSDFEDGIAFLRQSLDYHINAGGHKSLDLFLKTSAKDNGQKYTLQLMPEQSPFPYYQNPSSAAINGSTSANQSQWNPMLGYMMKMMQQQQGGGINGAIGMPAAAQSKLDEANERIKQLEMELVKKDFTREIDDLKGMVEAVQYEKRSKIEQIFDHPSLANIPQMVASAVLKQPMQTAMVAGAVQGQTVPIPNTEELEDANSVSDEQQEGIDLNRLFIAAQTLLAAGFQQPDVLLLKVATWASNNKEQAAMLLNNLGN